MNEHILVVDDEQEIADLLEIYLKNDGYTVHKFYNGKDALRCVESVPLDLAILDVMLPDMDGFQICRRIREKHYYPIIMLTAKAEEGDKIMGLTMGADDYITKPFNALEVMARVKTQLRRYMRYNSLADNKQKEVCELMSVSGREIRTGLLRTKNIYDESKFHDVMRVSEENGSQLTFDERRMMLMNEVHDIRGLQINKTTHKCFLYGKELQLTPIEFSILWYLCEHQGRVVPSEELFEAVWGEKYLNNNNTVMAHIGRLREKIGESAKKPKFIRNVWGVGYIIEK